MADGITVVAGIPIPSTSPTFLLGVAFHVVVGIACIVVGVLAMLSTKGRGRHSRFGTTYYWRLFAVFLSASVLAAVRWAEDYHLFILGVLSFAAASGDRLALRRRWWKPVHLHVIGMGLSYILVLTAFYVDNGKNLPVWQEFPETAFWLLPTAIGLPNIAYVLSRHPLAKHMV
ncbi:MAG: hypothetical protein HOP91_01480 [Sphingomonas sp.]|nr:hypothetical protein [Sphingomonas sp.]